MFEIVEGIVIILIISLQLYLAYRLLITIAKYGSIFDKEDLPSIKQKLVSKKVLESGNVDNILSYVSDENEEGSVITYIENNPDKKIFVSISKSIPYLNSVTTANSNVINTIVHYINVYLIKNRGASIDFHLIKDIVDKHTETIETQIENRIPAPLYLGLAATMLGIIFGLFSVNFDGGNNALDAIQPLINGVKYAMSASVIGLIITTAFSIKLYKDAQSETDGEKREFLSKLQTELMPKMGTGKIPEVSILSNKLDVFARTTAGAVSQLDGIVKTSKNTVIHERQLIQEIRQLNIGRITAANVEVFNHLGSMMDSFQNFAKYYEELDKSMASTSALLTNLKQFVRSTENINSILEGIKDTIQQSNDATAFFNTHIHSFERYNEAVREAVAKNDSTFQAAIQQLTDATSKQFEAFTNLVSVYDSKLSDAFKNSVEMFTLAMDEQVRRTEEAFERGRPNFEKLEKLEKLDSIEERLVSLEKQLSNSINRGNEDIISVLKNIDSSVKNSFKLQVSENGINSIGRTKKSAIGNVVSGIKMTAYGIVIGYGIFFALQFFNLI